MSGPYDKPPRHPAEAGGGHAPIPPVPVAARRHGAIPSAPPGIPRRPTEDDKHDKTKPVDRWAFKYRGNAGQPSRDDSDEEPGIAFDPAIELPEARALTVLFYQDTQTTQTPNPPQEADSLYTYDATAFNAVAIALGHVRLNRDPEESDQFTATQIYVAIPNVDGDFAWFLRQVLEPTIEIRWGMSYATGSYMAFTIDAWEVLDEGGVSYLSLQVTPVDHVINGPDGPIEDAEEVRIVIKAKLIPNAAVRARVTYRNGKSEVSFECDWSGGFQVFADRLELARVPFAPDPTTPYNDAAVDIAATVLADAPRPGGSLSLTITPVAVPTPTGDRFMEIPIHPFARRVNLIIKYGNDPDDEEAPGDAPLGQIFLAFVGKFGRSLCYIDAMSAREALFGPGLPIPASGVTKLVVSNRSADDSMQIGVVWRLEL